MKKSELKKIIKPLVKECINEVLLEEGMLSGVVSEVVRGLGTQAIVETAARHAPAQEPAPRSNPKAEETRRRMMEAVSKDAYNGVDLFEGTEAFTAYESSNRSAPKGGTDLGDPRDAGVDISSIMGASSKIWQAMK